MRRIIVTGLVIGLGATVGIGTESSIPFICADQVHAQGITGRGVTVVVIDRGIDYGDAGLFGSIVGGMTIKDGIIDHNGGSDPDGPGHGTFVSVIVTHPTGGVAPDAGIYSIRVETPRDVVLALRELCGLRAGDPSVRVANLSVGWGHYDCLCELDDQLNADLERAVRAALSEGVITVAATGDEAMCDGMPSPACHGGSVISVAASYDARTDGYPTRYAQTNLLSHGM